MCRILSMPPTIGTLAHTQCTRGGRCLHRSRCEQWQTVATTSSPPRRLMRQKPLGKSDGANDCERSDNDQNYLSIQPVEGAEPWRVEIPKSRRRPPKPLKGSRRRAASSFRFSQDARVCAYFRCLRSTDDLKQE